MIMERPNVMLTRKRERNSNIYASMADVGAFVIVCSVLSVLDSQAIALFWSISDTLILLRPIVLIYLLMDISMNWLLL